MKDKPKYEVILDWVYKKIESGELKDGSRLNSENELVALFGVSRQTVRRAIADLETRGIVRRRRGSGTFINILPEHGEVNALSPKERTNRIAVITTYINEYIFSPIIQAIEKVLHNNEYSIQLSFTNNAIGKERQILEGLLENMDIDGVIVEPTTSGLPNPNTHFYRELLARGIPVLFLNSYYEDVKVPHVSMNDYAAGKIATEYLLQCGHKEIGGIFKADDGQGRRRFSGYQDALLAAGVEVKRERVVWIDTELLAAEDADYAFITKRLKNCTACVCYNDEVAIKLQNICLNQGIGVPEELSIMGIDNSELAHFAQIPLSTVENPIEDLGKLAALGIMELINGHGLQENLELEPKVVERESVKKILDFRM